MADAKVKEEFEVEDTEEVYAEGEKMEVISDEDKTKILEIALKQFETADKFRQPRLLEIRALEDMLEYKTTPVLRGRYNIPFDSVLGNGFIDTFLAQVNQPPRIEFVDPKGGHQRGAEKLTAAIEYDSKPAVGSWAKKDRFTKRLCAVSNIGIFHIYAESDPEYKSRLSVVDHLDFLCEPMGGGCLEDHDFYGVTNNFYREDQIQSGIENLGFEKDVIAKLKATQTPDDKKVIEDQYQNKINRAAKRGLDIAANNYVGVPIFNLTRWYMTYKGRRISLMFDVMSKTIVKCDYLKNTYESDLWPDTYWQSSEDPFNAWAKGPFDRVAPVFETMKINLNEILNNVRKRNWDMKVIDGRFFPDISELDYRPDGVAIANVPAGKSLRDGIMYAQTPEVTVSLNFNAYLNNLAGINSGISDQSKGDTSKEVLGLAKIDEMNISKRMKLVGDSYQDMYNQVALLWSWGIYEHMTEGMMVKIAGVNGSEWEEIQKEDTDPDYDIRIISRSDEIQAADVEQNKKIAALERISGDQALSAVTNPTWRLEQELVLAGFDADDVERAKDIQGNLANDQIEEARRGIEMVLEGKDPDLYRKATMPFLNYIDNYMLSRSNLKPEELQSLQEYFDMHVEVVAGNEARNAEGMPTGADAESGLDAPSDAVPPTAPVPTPLPTDQIQ